MANTEIRFTTPTGRMVGGSLYRPKTTNSKGEPLLGKSASNMGQPVKQFNIGVALPKTPGATHWSQETWGAPIWNMGHAEYRKGEAQRPDFAWKITDGDSTIPNTKGHKPCDQVGYPGHWVIWLSTMQAPKVAALVNGKPEYAMEPDAIKAGYYVQVMCSVKPNFAESPGLYWNPDIVCRIGYGAEISQGPDIADANFAATALPAGASHVPVGVAALPNPQPAPGSAPAYPVVPAPVAPAYVAPAAPVPVHPAPGFVQVPPPPSAPVAPPAAPGGLPPGRVWLNPTHTYAQFKLDPAWTDEALVTNGHMR